MRVVAISDTHMRHERLDIASCDLLVHAGDHARRGTRDELIAFARWLGRQPARVRVVVAGNWDRYCESEPEQARSIFDAEGVRYLEDEGAIVDGLRIWGSPVTPRFGDMAFNRGPSELAEHWAKMPADLDLLVTHGPPRGVGDRMILGKHVGDDHLRSAVVERRPRVHVFGHIHEAAGPHALDGSTTRFFNVASSRLLPIGVRPPMSFEL